MKALLDSNILIDFLNKPKKSGWNFRANINY